MRTFDEELSMEQFAKDEGVDLSIARNRDDILARYKALPVGDRQPLPEDRFSVRQMPMFYDGDYPAWPAQLMLEWVPKRIQEAFATRAASVLNGPPLPPPGEADDTMGAN